MAYMKKMLNGLKFIYKIESTIFKLMTKMKQTFYQLRVDFHKVQYCDYFFFYFMLMTC